MAEEIHDPVQRYRMSLHREGENLIVETRVEPGGGVPMHFHPNQEELFSIQAGQVRFKVGRRSLVAGPGDELVVPPGTKHRFKNSGDGEARFRAELRPALDAQGFFEDTSAAAREGLFTRQGIPTSLRGARRGAEILDRYKDVAVVCNPPRFLQLIMIA